MEECPFCFENVDNITEHAPICFDIQAGIQYAGIDEKS